MNKQISFNDIILMWFPFALLLLLLLQLSVDTFARSMFGFGCHSVTCTGFIFTQYIVNYCMGCFPSREREPKMRTLFSLVQFIYHVAVIHISIQFHTYLSHDVSADCLNRTRQYAYTHTHTQAPFKPSDWSVGGVGKTKNKNRNSYSNTFECLFANRSWTLNSIQNIRMLHNVNDTFKIDSSFFAFFLNRIFVFSFVSFLSE